MKNDIKIIDYKNENANKKFTKSLRKTGFAVIKNHPINMALVNSVYKEWNEFFYNKKKHNFLFDKNKKKQDGFFPFGTEHAKNRTERDLKEFFNYYADGNCPKDHKKQTNELYHTLCKLAEELLKWIEKNTPPKIRKNFSEPLSKMVEKSELNLLRIIHYPPPKETDNKAEVRAAAHEDINLITLLCSATSAGLQAMDVNGEWHEVPCNPRLIIVNTGDMLQMASGGYFPSTTHRVINPKTTQKEQSRMSMPLFLHPHRHVILSKKYTAGKYLDERLKDIGLK